MIMAGIRISAVTAVGLMTIAAFIGAGGLGYLVFSGVQTVDNNMILAGALPACILALLIDYIVGKLESSLSYKSKQQAAASKSSKSPLKKGILLSATAILVVGVGATAIYSKKQMQKTPSPLAQKNFSEQIILGNMVADLIEDKTDIHVERKK
ncbi:hypothetical protein GCM10020331_046810 [Ectobacillus funiculus]